MKKTPKIGSAYNPQEKYKRQHLDTWQRREQERTDMVRVLVIMGLSWVVVLGACVIYTVFFR